MADSASRISPFRQFTVISSVVQSARMFVRTLSMPLLGRSLRTYVSEGDEKTFVGKGRSAHAAESFDFGELFSDDLLYFDRKTVYPFRVHRQGVRDGLDGKSRDGAVTVGQGHSNDDSVSTDGRHERSVCFVRTVGVRYRNRLSRRRSRGPSASVRRGRLNVGTASAEDDGAGGGNGDFFVHGRCFPGIAPMIRRRVRESSPYSRKLRKKRPNERSYGVEVSGIEGDAHLKALVRADFHIQTSPLLCRLYEGVRLVSLERRFAQADAGRLFDFVEGCRRDDVALADFPEPYRLGIHRFEDGFGFRLEPLERRGKGERKDEPVLVAIVKRRSDRDNGKRERRLFSKRPPRDRHGYEKKERHGEKRRFLWQVRSDELSSKVDEGRDVQVRMVPPGIGFPHFFRTLPHFLREFPYDGDQEERERRVREMVEYSASETESAFENQEYPGERHVVFSIAGAPSVEMVERVPESERDGQGYRKLGIRALLHRCHRHDGEQEQGGGEGISDFPDFVIAPRSVRRQSGKYGQHSEYGEFRKEDGVHEKGFYYPASILPF